MPRKFNYGVDFDDDYDDYDEYDYEYDVEDNGQYQSNYVDFFVCIHACMCLLVIKFHL